VQGHAAARTATATGGSRLTSCTFVYDRVRERTRQQTRMRSTDGAEGNIVLAMAAPQVLPSELEGLIDHGGQWMRLGVVDELWRHAGGGTARLGTAARQALERMTHDVDPVRGGCGGKAVDGPVGERRVTSV